jgi:general secretion pathway protein D
MPFKFCSHLTPVRWTCSKALSLLVLIAAFPASAADSVVQLAQREAMKRQMRVDSTGADLKRASDLVMEGKTEEALNLLESLYQALPEAPLTQEARSVTKAGYLSVGCMRSEELMAAGKRPEADTLLEKLLRVSPNDKQVLDLQKRFADPDRYPPALTAEHIENVRNVQSLLLKGNSAVEIGDYDLAIRLYQDVIRIDSANSAARRGMERAEREKARYFDAAIDQQRSKMLNAVAQAWEEPVPPSSAELSALFGARVQASATKSGGRDSIVDKLRNYRMPKVEFQQATIVEILELLRLRSRDLDPQGKGVDFVLNVPDDSRQRQITLTLTDVPLEEVLRYVCEAASVTYRVEEHAVMISSLSEKNATLVTRSFRVPPDFIQNSPVAAAAPPGDPFQPAAPAGGLTLRRMGAKEFLESRGIPFPDGASASFASGTSTLVVRNTATNMEMVENLVDLAAKSSPKMVVVSVRMLEVNQEVLDELGFDWLLAGVGLNKGVFAGGGSSGNGVPFDADNFGFKNTAGVAPVVLFDPGIGANFTAFPGQPLKSALAGPIPLGGVIQNGGGGGQLTAGLRSGSFASGGKSLDNLLKTGSAVGAGNSAPAPGILSLAGVFTNPQFQTVLRGLSQKKGVDVSSCPSVTTKSGVKATVEVTREFIYPTEFDPPQLPQGGGGGRNNGVGISSGPMIATPTTPTAFEMRKTGITLDVEPVVSDDARSVELVLAPEVVDFEGFVNYGSPIFSPASSSYLPFEMARLYMMVNYNNKPIFPIVLLPENLIPAPPAPFPPWPKKSPPAPGSGPPYFPGVPNGGFPPYPGPWWRLSVTTGWLPLTQAEQLITPNKILQPVFKSSKVSTSVKVWDGQTIVLGGLKQQEHNIVEDQVPILGDLPFVGRMFRTQTKQTNTKNIIIFVTVNVIDPSGQKVNPDTASVSQ